MRQHPTSLRRISVVCLMGLMSLAILSTWVQAQTKITSPEEFFGFRLGSDRKVAHWDKIVEYYNLLMAESDKIDVIDMGPSTMGPPLPAGYHFFKRESGESRSLERHQCQNQ